MSTSSPSRPGAGSTDPHAADRLVWVDVARGICIMLVVLLHTHGTLTRVGLDLSAVDRISVPLSTVRMPAFFLVSGLFARRALTRPWRDFWVLRPAFFGYLYLLWSLIFLVGFVTVAMVGSASVAATARSRIGEFLFLDGELWYLAALAVYFLVARLSRAIPPAVQMAVAAVLWQLVAVGVVPVFSWGTEHLLSLYVFFLAGLFGRSIIMTWAERINPIGAAVLVITWTAGAVAVEQLDPDGRLRGAVLPLVGVPMLLALAVLAARNDRWLRVFRPGVQRLGEATLPIYVLHPLALVGVGAAVTLVGRPVAAPLWAAVPVALAVAVAVALGCLVAARALRPLPWLFALPRGR